MKPVPDWQLPLGVDRGLWDYLHQPGIAENYDAGLENSSLFHLDVDFFLRHCTGPARVLDLGCGTGRLLLALAKRGWWVLGVDLSAGMLQVARRWAESGSFSVHLLQANIADLRCLREESFDHAACLFSTLGMVRGQAIRLRVLQEVHRVLRREGRLVLHVHNRWFRFWDSPGRSRLFSDLRRQWKGDPQAGDHVMPVHQGVTGLTLHLFTRSEVIHLLQIAGFRVVALEAVSLRRDGRIPWSWCLGNLRAYGFLITAEKLG